MINHINIITQIPLNITIEVMMMIAGAGVAIVEVWHGRVVKEELGTTNVVKQGQKFFLGLVATRIKVMKNVVSRSSAFKNVVGSFFVVPYRWRRTQLAEVHWVV